MNAKIHIDLNLLRIFLTVVERGSMTRGAAALGIEVSRVSRSIARLESDLESMLILRTTRRFQVTEAGRRLYQESHQHLRQLEEAQAAFRSSNEATTGLVRMTAPKDFGGSLLSDYVFDLSQRYPGLLVDLICTDEHLDLVAHAIDVGLRIGPLADSSLKTKLLGRFQVICVASPGYLERIGWPAEPAELVQHDCMHLSMGASDERGLWRMTSGRRSVEVAVRPRMIVNHIGSAIRFARAGHGFVLLPAPMVANDLSQGSLIRVLPDWNAGTYSAHFIFLPQRIASPRVRLVMDFLEMRITELLRVESK